MTPTPAPTPTVSGQAVIAALEDVPASPDELRRKDEMLFHIFLPTTYTPSAPSVSPREGLLLPPECNDLLVPMMVGILNTSVPSDSVTLQSFKLWEEHQPNLDPRPMADAVKGLQEGETFPVYVYEQNAAVLITQQALELDLYTISTFRLTLPMEKVTSSLSSTFAMAYPTYSITTPGNKLLPCTTMFRQLRDLNEVDMRESVATEKKANTKVEEKRDVSDPIYVSKWLLSVLANNKTKPSNPEEFPHVLKKVRDTVRYAGGHVFRRSGLWVCVKATLHLLLVKEYGDEVGNLIYKTVMLKVMTERLNGDLTRISKITIQEFLSKIARRAVKLEKLYCSLGNVMLSWAMKLYHDVLQLTATATKQQHDWLKGKLTDLIRQEKMESEFDLSNISLWIWQTLKHNNIQDLFRQESFMDKFSKIGHLEAPILLRGVRHRDYTKVFDVAELKLNAIDLNLGLYDFERNVGFWQTSVNPPLTIKEATFIWGTFRTYVNLGEEIYGMDPKKKDSSSVKDPVAYSRFILTMLKIIQVWDHIVCEFIPLLRMHRTGINTLIFKSLLITNQLELIDVERLETYFDQRNQKATYPSLIEELKPTMDSFSNRYVELTKKGLHFKEVRNQILKWAEVKIEEKLAQVQLQRVDCEKLEAKIRALECEYVIDNWRRKHSPACEKCALTRREKKMAVTIFEQPIPVGIEQQNAVVFELMIPEEIAVLRDMLHIFHKIVSGNDTAVDLYGPWHKHKPIANCTKRPGMGEYVVGLYSEKKLFVETHYRDLHPMKRDEDFIKPVGFNCVYASTAGHFVTGEGDGLTKRLTLRVQKRSRYSAMQEGINGTVTQNEAIARQNECHPDLSLTEFVEFYSLRSVRNLEFRNLFRALNAGNLSLREESVFNLVCQVMWTVGDTSATDYLRMNQLDFHCKEFCEKFLELLESIRQRHSDNWKDHYVYLTIQFLAQTIASMNKVVERKAFKLLASCRQDAVRWSAEIQRILKSLTEAPREEINALRVKLIEVNCCIALSFRGLDELFLYEVMAEGEFKDWLLAVARIHDNLVLLGDYTFKGNLKNLLNRVDELGVCLEPFIQEAVRSSDILTTFVEHHHCGSSAWKMREKQRMTWQCFEDGHGPLSGQIYFCDIEPVEKFGNSSRIQMDIIKGKFLVDGSPVGYLPSTIEKHRDFIRAFGNKSFEVQPKAFQVGRMITKEAFNGSTYSFFVSADKTLTITEHRQNEQELVLVSDTKFKKNIPDLLIENYTHWFNSRDGIFDFFPKEQKLTAVKPEYQLVVERRHDYSEGILHCVDNHLRVAVDVSCPAYPKLLQVMERLELSEYLMVWCDKNSDHRGPNSFAIELPRMGLTFNVRNVEQQGPSRSSYPKKRRLGDITSKEYRGMRVSRNQSKTETLIGLQQNLLLEDANLRSNAKMNAILLVPHGVPMIRTGKKNKVYIDITQPRSPPFFAYELDERLKQIKSGDSRAGWLYLAYLHALTNHGIADPMTGVSGMERAIQILQSGQCFSSEPLDGESQRTMEMIMELCPIRTYYPPKMTIMEMTHYADKPLRVVGDTYYLIIEQLMDDSERLKFLYPDWEGYGDPEGRFRETDLIWKHYWLRHYYSNELSRLKDTFLPEDPDIESFNETSPLEDSILDTIQLSQDLQNWTCTKIRASVDESLKSLFLCGKDLKGVLQEDEDKFPIKEGLYIWMRLDFRDYWLDLYNLARTVKHKNLIPEWTFLLCYLAFRDDSTTLEHLNILQAIAVNHETFANIDPPPYDIYTNTKETSFDKAAVKKVLKSYKKPWEWYMDRHVNEQKEYEDELQFVDRMRPLFEMELEAQVNTISDMIEAHWPIDNVDWLDKLEREQTSEIDLMGAQDELNVKLKSWYRNRELFIFLEQLSDKFASLNLSFKRTPDFKKLFWQNWRNQLNTFASRKRLCIDFDSHSLHRQFKFANESVVEMCRALFHVDVESQRQERQHKLSSVASNFPEFPLNLDEEDPILKEYMKDLKKSWELHHRQLEFNARLAKSRSPDGSDDTHGARNRKTNQNQDTLTLLSDQQRQNLRLCGEIWETIRSTFLPKGPNAIPLVDQILCNAEVFPRIVPITMLKLLMEEPEGMFQTNVRDLVGGYAVQLTLEQKSSRCLRYANAKSKKGEISLELEQELSNNGHENWNPASRPEWLLFEIESDLMIRPVQAKVAERMERPPNNENALVQLNMGEGKTWVIVPLLALSLADGDKLCRVTVLKSLFQINKTYLSFRIGSIILDRRVYCFPCRRDYRIGVEEAGTMKDVYDECLDLKGVVLTLPEHRLSFELKAYERFHAHKFEEGLEIYNLQKWIKDQVRDVLDESDEILHVRYQLIYTLGKQLPVGGGSTRWTVIQDLLAVLPEEMKALEKQFGQSFIEMKEKPNTYPHTRILKTDGCASELVRSLAIKIINRKTLIQVPRVPESMFFPLFDFLTNEQLNREGLNKIMVKGGFSESVIETLLILRGYLACGVLVNCLMKRWRVNYGVAPSGSKGYYRRMAVPFRAKDVASDRVEFGHPDVAILLTQLSYYYSGLDTEQLEHCFIMLYLEPNPPQEYARWVSLIPNENTNKSRIRYLSSVNLNDFFQKTQVLFPLLQYNRNIINFYLGRAVFPHESKQFGWKIGCSPWDLCNTFTTGFSGTNDSKILLPSTIQQKDLHELRGTNGGVLAALIFQRQQGNYEVLKEANALEILKKLVHSNIRVLLDVGALMLELDNEQVARKWLKLANDINISVDAAVYFDANDKLVVVDKLGIITPYELSTFRNRLDRCVIYLDDAHTRGTDLKIPNDNTAVVTLGKGVGKDKLVQGCMRMRKLGKGHYVKFWASREVHESILPFCDPNPDETETGPTITAREVLLWAIKNNQQQIKDGMVHWASAGVYVAQKLSSLKLYENSRQDNSDLIVLSESCSQKEQIELKAMFGDTREIVPFPNIVDHLLKRVKRELGKLLQKRSSSTEKELIKEIVERYGQRVVDHVDKYVPTMMRSTQLLDEEQERELEHELEAQCHKQLPLRAKPMEHSTTTAVQEFITAGSLLELEKWTVKAPLAFQKSSVWKGYPDDRWGKHLYCTKDFVSVVFSGGGGGGGNNGNGGKIDDYLRPLEWFACLQTEGGEKTVIVFLSNFEVGEYLPLFRSGHTRATLHMYGALITEGQKSLHDQPSLTLPMRTIQFNKWINPPLTLFSGGWYFTSSKEEEEYAWYLCYCRNGEKVEDKVLEEGGIVGGGWVTKKYWNLVNVSGVFHQCPEPLVKEILRCRWGIKRIGRESGVGRVLTGTAGLVPNEGDEEVDCSIPG